MRILVTGSAGLIGGEMVEYFGSRGHDMVGIDNNMRREYLGDEAHSLWNLHRVVHKCTQPYVHHSNDIREIDAMRFHIFEDGKQFDAVIHCAANPSIEVAAEKSSLDYDVCVDGTENLLKLTRRFSPNAVFIYMSDMDMFGDSTYGKHKRQADELVQSYNSYPGTRTVCLRLGNITGPGQSGVERDGILSHLLKTAINGKTYHTAGDTKTLKRSYLSSTDLARAVEKIIQDPKVGAYEIGGGDQNAISTVNLVEKVSKAIRKTVDVAYSDTSNYDHALAVTNEKFIAAYPDWSVSKNLDEIIGDMIQQDYWGRYSDHEDTKTYDLNENSVVLDVGGYRGAFTDDIVTKYNPYVILFEPVKEFYEVCGNRFRYHIKVMLHNFGLSDKDGYFRLAKQGQNTSAFRGGPGQPELAADRVYGEAVPETCFLRDVKSVIDNMKNPEIDLMSINCEGGEFEIIPRLIETGLISRVKNLQVQFHRFVPGADEKRDKIREQLCLTHTEKFCYPWVWESWMRKAIA